MKKLTRKSEAEGSASIRAALMVAHLLGRKKMWPLFAKIIARSKGLNAQLGEVILATPQEHGIMAGTFFEWRVKKSIDGATLYIEARLLADASLESTGYIHFDIDAAIRLRDNLNYCIEEASKLEPQFRSPWAPRDSPKS